MNRLLLVCCLLLVSCTRQQSPIYTDRTLPSNLLDAQIRAYIGNSISVGSFTPDTTYAVVSSKSISGVYDRFKKDIFNKGITEWHTRFDCNKFAAAFCSFAQMEYYSQTWGESRSAQALAIAEVWYEKSTQNGYINHAIVLAITEIGVLFIEPQSGERLNLSSKEIKSIFFIKF